MQSETEQIEKFYRAYTQLNRKKGKKLFSPKMVEKNPRSDKLLTIKVMHTHYKTGFNIFRVLSLSLSLTHIPLCAHNMGQRSQHGSQILGLTLLTFIAFEHRQQLGRVQWFSLDAVPNLFRV